MEPNFFIIYFFVAVALFILKVVNEKSVPIAELFSFSWMKVIGLTLFVMSVIAIIAKV